MQQKQVIAWATVLMILAMTFSGTAAEWKVAPDALASFPKISAATIGDIPASSVAGKAVFGSSQAPHVLLTQLVGGGIRTQAWDLQSGRATPQIQIDQPGYGVGAKLSPDGKHVVGNLSKGGAYHTGVWEVATGKKVWTCEDSHRIQPIRDFADNRTAIEMFGDTIKLWDIHEDRLVREIMCRQRAFQGGLALSANRKYAARAEADNQIRLYDLTTGKLVGSLEIRSFKRFSKLTIFKLDFSEDGKEMAMIARISFDQTTRTDDTLAIASWSLSSGKQVAQHIIPREINVLLDSLGKSPDIDCLPGHYGWLIKNAAILERTTGKVIWTLPLPPRGRSYASPTFVLPDGQLILNLGTEGHGPGHKLFTAYTLPLQELKGRLLAVRGNKADHYVEELKKNATAKSEFATTDWGQVHKRFDALKAIPPGKRVNISQQDLQRTLVDLESGIPTKVEDAIERLGRSTPIPAAAGRVSQMLKAASATQGSGFARVAGFWVAMEWERAAAMPGNANGTAKPGDKSELSSLEADIHSGDYVKLVTAMQRLGQLKTPAAAAVIVKNFHKQAALCEQSLNSMGPVAAPAVAELLKEPKWNDKVTGIRILSHIGTAKQIPALKAVLDDENPIVRGNAAKAIQKLEGK